MLRMKEALESLSLGSGSVLVAVLSVGVVWLLCAISPVSFRWIWVVLVPFTLAYCLYWSPVWLGSDDIAQFGAWAGLAVGTWFLSGVIPSGLLVLVLQKRQAK